MLIEANQPIKQGKLEKSIRNSFEIIGNDQNSKDKVKNVYLRIFLDEEWEKMDLQNFCDVFKLRLYSLV